MSTYTAIPTEAPFATAAPAGAGKAAPSRRRTLFAAAGGVLLGALAVLAVAHFQPAAVRAPFAPRAPPARVMPFAAPMGLPMAAPPPMGMAPPMARAVPFGPYGAPPPVRAPVARAAAAAPPAPVFPPIRYDAGVRGFAAGALQPVVRSCGLCVSDCETYEGKDESTCKKQCGC